ncbi:MAG: NAD(P)/FAD-dependent oxidoreductase [Desulfotomaculaceae bacterium]|nr:NAD(P)/FAD-dependent oxidoreductase [Desulfotomaculaceae bacterium]
MNKEIYDIAIIGCGPAGLSAAINASIRRKSIVLLGGELCTPKLQKSPLVSNYLGLPEIDGRTLRDKFLRHTRSLDIPILQEKVESVDRSEGDIFSLQTKESEYQARTIIITTGVTVAELVEGEREFIGKGVSYCATCDGPLFAGQQVAVLAFTNEGIEDANFLADICSKVYFISGGGLVPNGLKEVVEVIENQKVEAITGNEFVSEIKIGDRALAVNGVFIYRETYMPAQLISRLNLTDNHINVDRLFQTNVKGVFAAGDCTGKPYQLAKAVGEGQVAALSAVQYLDH